MKTSEYDTFWSRYDREVRPVIERACVNASRLHSDGTMDAGDMAAWVHTRVWKMLENSTFPTFHDDPSIDEAIERLTTHAGILARWSYLALCRRHWRRLEHETASDLSRVEHLSITRRSEAPIERKEAIDEALAKVRETLSDSVRQKLAASLQDKSERRRAALALGATRREDDRLMTQIDAGMFKENTIQQMRSRARKHAADAVGASLRLPVIALVACLGVMLASPAAEAGEQSGGRKGTGRCVQQITAAYPAITNNAPDFITVRAAPLARGEQSGGRGPKPG
jgi:hypothetical protein